MRSRRLGCDGWDLWVESGAAKEATDALTATYHAADENEWERLRIENGIPRWGHELTPDIIPPEANLAERAIDYEKGCYIGQEVISRMKMSGQVRQRLCGLVSEKGLYPGMELRVEEKVVGRVTSAVFSARTNSNIGLAIFKRGYNDIGTSLLASNGRGANQCSRRSAAREKWIGRAVRRCGRTAAKPARLHKRSNRRDETPNLVQKV